MPSLSSRLANQMLRVYCRTQFTGRESAQTARERMARTATPIARLVAKHPGASFRAGDLGGVTVETVMASPDREEPTLLYFHGGGYFMGSPATHRGFALRLSYRARCRVVLVDYRLAPESPFPAALDDAIAAYRGLLESTPPDRIVIGGDSAGGGLTLTLIMRAREEGLPPPAAALCLSPWTDLTNTGDSRSFNVGRDFMFTPTHLDRWSRFYVGDADPKHPLISPVYGSFEGFPPLFLQVGSEELLLDDARRVAGHAQAARVPVTLQVWESMQHCWQIALPRIPESKNAVQAIAAFCNAHWRLP